MYFKSVVILTFLIELYHRLQGSLVIVFMKIMKQRYLKLPVNFNKLSFF
jgi:hypothetical protein